MRADALSAALEMSPIIMGHRHDTEANRRLAQPIVERLVDERLCRMAMVRELDGLELPPCDALEVYEALAGAEASVAWIVWNNSLPCFFSRYLNSGARTELFGDASWLYASSTRPSGTATIDKDGYRVNGRWALVSGCELAEWIALMCIVHENGQVRTIAPGVPEMRFMFVRRGDFEILDTWHVGGLRGTGSHDVAVADKYVPRKWTASPGDPPTLERAIDRLPIICTMAAGFGAQALGIAQTALNTLLELSKTKIAVDGGPGLRDRPAVQVLIARRSAALEAARAYLRRCTSELWEMAEGGTSEPIEGITAVWGAALHAVDVSKTTVEEMYSAAGTTSLYTDCSLERAHRDFHAMLRHIVVQPMWLEDAGRVQLGMEPVHPLYAI